MQAVKSKRFRSKLDGPDNKSYRRYTMRKYYLEVESYRDDNSLCTVRVINQATKNRREKFIKNLKRIKLDFLKINYNVNDMLSLCEDLNMASTKLMSIANRELYRLK